MQEISSVVLCCLGVGLAFTSGLVHFIWNGSVLASPARAGAVAAGGTTTASDFAVGQHKS
jgi:hypothetical protein